MPNHDKNKKHYHFLFTELELAIEQNNRKNVKAITEKLNVADLALILSDLKEDKKKSYIKLIGKNIPEDLFLKLHDSVIDDFYSTNWRKEICKYN